MSVWVPTSTLCKRSMLYTCVRHAAGPRTMFHGGRIASLSHVDGSLELVRFDSGSSS